MHPASPAFTDVRSEDANVGPVVVVGVVMKVEVTEVTEVVAGAGSELAAGVVTIVDTTVDTTGFAVVDSAAGTGAPTDTARTFPSNDEPSISRTFEPRPPFSTRVAPGTAAATVTAAARLPAEYSTVIPR